MFLLGADSGDTDHLLGRQFCATHSSDRGIVRNKNAGVEPGESHRPPVQRQVQRTRPTIVHTRKQGGIDLVTRALKHQGLWLTITYVGLILLMARAYA